MAPASEIKCRMAERAQPAWRSIRLGLPSLQRIRNLGGAKQQQHALPGQRQRTTGKTTDP